MASTAVLAVKIISDARGATSGLDQTSSKFGKLGKVAGIAGAAAATGLAVIGAGAVSAIKDAGDLEQSIGAIDTVFGKSAGKMHTWAQGAAQDVGLTRNEFNELGTLIGSQLKNGGTSMDQLAPKTRNLIKTGADLSSMFGGTTKEAVEALSSALKGERDPIEKYGVSLNQAKIDAQAASMGFKKVDGALSAEAQQAATLALIMKQTGDAHGNFAKESGTLAGQQQRLTASLSNVKTEIGMALLPIATQFFGFLNTTAVPALKQTWGQVRTFATSSGVLGSVMGVLGPIVTAVVGGFRAIAPAIMAVIARVGPLVATIGGVLGPILVRVYQTLVPAVVGAFRRILPAVGTVIGAIRPLVAVIGQRLTPVINFLLPVVRKVFQAMGPIVSGALRTVAAIIRTITAALRGDWSKVWAGIKSILSAAWSTIKAIAKGGAGVLKALLSDAWAAIRSTAQSAWAKVVSTLQTAWTNAKNAVTNGISNVMGKIRGLPREAASALSGIGSALVSAGQSLIQGLIDGITAKLGALRDKLGSVTNLLPDWKGPAQRDKKLLTPAGRLIIQGLMAGIEDELPTLRRQLGGVTDLVAGTRFRVGVDGRALSTSSSTRVGTGAPTRVEVHFHGLVTDPDAVARQIRKVLGDYDTRIGVVA